MKKGQNQCKHVFLMEIAWGSKARGTALKEFKPWEPSARSSYCKAPPRNHQARFFLPAWVTYAMRSAYSRSIIITQNPSRKPEGNKKKKKALQPSRTHRHCNANTTTLQHRAPKKRNKTRVYIVYALSPAKAHMPTQSYSQPLAAGRPQESLRLASMETRARQEFGST